MPNIKQLPLIPEWFIKELRNLGLNPFGEPRFRIVDGQKEMHFIAGREQTKYQIKEPERYTYMTFERIDSRTGKMKEYPTRRAAESDLNPYMLQGIGMNQVIEIHEIGYPCYILESWTSPEELNRSAWDKERFSNEFNELTGKFERIDLLGPFPSCGRYDMVFEIVDEDGRAIAPNQRTLDEIQRRMKVVENDNRTLDQRLRDDASARAEQAQKIQDQWADDFIQEAGIHNRMMKEGNAISRPILKEFGGVH